MCSLPLLAPAWPRIKQWWFTLTVPPAPTHILTLSERDRWRKLHLLSLCLLGAFVLTLPMLVLTSFSWDIKAFTTYSYYLIIISALCYTRRGALQTAASLYLFGYVLVAAINLSTLTGDGSFSFLWISFLTVFPPVLAGFFLTTWSSFVFALLVSFTVSGIFLAKTQYAPALRVLSLTSKIEYLVCINMVIYGLAVVGVVYAYNLKKAVSQTDRAEEIAVLEQREVEQQKRELERQREVDALKDQFIMIASHELRTPLTAIHGYLELLSDSWHTLPDALKQSFLEKAHRSSGELTLLVNNILDVSRIQHSENNQVAHCTLSEVALHPAVLHILEMLEGVAHKQQCHLNVAIPEGVSVLADEQRLCQILLNLIGNALKYAATDVLVTASSGPDEEYTTVYIRDFGLGIPVEDQGRLFGRFVRLERDMNSPVRGTGLGLYVCKQLVEAMGGRIWVESSGVAGEGSTFAFTLRTDKV